MPGRVITRLAFPFPFSRCDFEQSKTVVRPPLHRIVYRKRALTLPNPSISISTRSFRWIQRV